MNDDLLAPGRVAVITGAALGIGAAAARHFSALGMRLCLLDRNEDALRELAGDLGRGADVRTTVGDVTSTDDLNVLCASAYDGFGEVAVLMNNAGVIAGAGPWTDPSAWRRQLEVNLLSIVTAQSIFVPRMLAQLGRGAVVNLGSKEGITTPPGNAAYSVAKAGVKVLTEQLAHERRAEAGNKVTAHLLVPGVHVDADERRPEARRRDHARRGLDGRGVARPLRGPLPPRGLLHPLPGQRRHARARRRPHPLGCPGHHREPAGALAMAP